MKAIAELNNKYQGGLIEIIGTGPSLDAYDFDKDCDARIIINRAMAVAPIMPEKTYWLGLDYAFDGNVKGDWDIWLKAIMSGCGVKAVFQDPMFAPKKVGRVPAPTGNNIYHFFDLPEAERRHTLIDMSRDEIAKSNQLYTFCGAGCSAAHFAWYLGAEKVRLVGLDGGHSYAKNIKGQYDKSKRDGFGYVMAREFLELVIDWKKLEIEK